MAKLMIELRPSERKALQRSAYDERRKVQDQAAHFIRLELARRGVVLPTQLDAEPANVQA